MARRAKHPKVQKTQRDEVKLLGILKNGYFVKFELSNASKVNEPRIKLWRAAIDQALKDIIEHYLVIPNDASYLDVTVWLTNSDDDFLVCCDYSSLDPVLVHKTFIKIEQMAQQLYHSGIQLA